MKAGSTHERGSEGEALACAFLRQQGYTILTTNYRFLRGEVDVIARDGEALVFCEVKMRESDEFGAPEYAVTPWKQQRIRRVAEGFLVHHAIREMVCRFDVIAIERSGGRTVINHIRDAF